MTVLNAPANALLAKGNRRTRARAARNTLAGVLVSGCFVLAMIPLVWILWTVAAKGIGLLASSDWWLQSQRGITSQLAGGGAYHAIVGSLLTVGICALIAVPIGVAGAIFLVEYARTGRARGLARVVGFAVDILSGLPSIVAALFVYAVWVTILGLDRVGFAVSLSLVLLMIPVVLRSTEEMLRLVPDDLREASYALGVSRATTILRVVVPTAFSGIVTGIMLGLARVLGETAPLLILGPYTKSINLNPFAGNLAALPTMINQDRTEFLAPAVNRTWAAAATLVLSVLVLYVGGRLLDRFGPARRIGR